MNRTVLVVTIVATVLGCSIPDEDDGKVEAVAEPYKLQQTIYYGGDIVTMEGDEPQYAEAVVQREGKIVFVGSKEEALATLKGKADEVDLHGKTMLPGFIDPHGHFMFALNMVNQVNVANPPVGPCTDIPSTIAAVEAYQAEAQVP